MNTWTQLAHDIHADNVKAGWWTNPHTGENLLASRDRLNLCMLVVTELNEAFEAYVNDSDDDKLPQYKGVGVELADAQIRILDMLGAEISLKPELLNDPVAVRWLVHHDTFGSFWINQLPVSGFAVPYANGVGYVANAAEAYRKSDRVLPVSQLASALTFIENLGVKLGFNMHELREAKREFNRNRADHKMENRKAEGGKIY